MTPKFYFILKLWLPLAIITTALSFLIYWAVQQDYRISANDPQIQMAQDASRYLANGGNITFASGNKVEISQSLAPYIMVFNLKKELISTTGALHGKPAQIPSGVFDYTKKTGEDRFTWQPEVGVRSAVVLSYFSGKNSGYVLVGKSLREVEKREDMLLKGVFATWFLTLFLTLILIYLFDLKLIWKPKK